MSAACTILRTPKAPGAAPTDEGVKLHAERPVDIIDNLVTGFPVLTPLRRNCQHAAQGDLCRRLSHHDLEIAGHDPPTHVRIEQPEIFRGKS